MLEQTKKTYEEIASLHINNWRELNKNTLIREAVAHREDKLFEGYLSAAMLKYWDKMLSYYYKCRLVITPEDAHSWLVTALMYAIDNHPWDRPDSTIYQDKNGPDKVVNRVLESRRVTFYQQLNRFNRKINSVMLSLDTLTEDGVDTKTPVYEDEHRWEVDEIIQNYFNKKDYFTAFMIDSIVYEKHKLTFHSKKLATHLLTLDDFYCSCFAARHNIDKSKVVKASTYITRMTRYKVKSKIMSTKEELKRVLKD